MKIKKIEAIVNKERRIVVSGGAYCQWLQFREACYPLYGLPPLAKISFFKMFDIPADKWEKYYYNELPLPENVSFDEVCKEEQVLDRGRLHIMLGGRTLEPLVTSQGLIFFDVRYLAPFADDDNYELYERTAADGSPYIAVKSGMELAGIILPHDVVDEDFIKTLEDLLELSRVALENQQKRCAAADEGQMTMEEAGK